MRAIIFPRVERDLDQITEYIARDSAERALTFVRELRAQFLYIARNPEAFRLRPEIGRDVRSLAYGNYVILFRVASDVVEIRRVVHGMRALKKLPL